MHALLVSLGVDQRLGHVHLGVELLVGVSHGDAAAHVVAPRLVEPEVEDVGEEEVLLLLVSALAAQLEQGRRGHLELLPGGGLGDGRDIIDNIYVTLLIHIVE